MPLMPQQVGFRAAPLATTDYVARYLPLVVSRHNAARRLSGIFELALMSARMRGYFVRA